MVDFTLEADQLTKRFGARTAVADLTVTARPGDVLGLLGPNGAGKTTAIRLLSTVLTPTSGRFSIAGVPSSRPADIRRQIGVVPESAGYPGHLSGREYLCYHARLFGQTRSGAARTAEKLLAEMGLAERASSRISTYSRGMRQRLGIARALAHEPAVVLLDEPALGLDPAGQRQMLEIVRDIARHRGATVLLSTHTLAEVEQVCTRVLILDKGRIAASGTVDAIIRTAGRRTAALRVPVEQIGRARLAIAEIPGATTDVAIDTPDLLSVFVADGDLNAVLSSVLAADVPVLRFEADGARLSDAFLALTGGDNG